jgi:hypothetical protein
MLTLPVPTNKDDDDDVQTFEVLLRQYGCLPMQEVPEVKGQAAVASRSSGDLRSLGITSATSSTPGGPPLPPRSPVPSVTETKQQGRLVLVDSTSGEVVGEIDQAVNVEEDPALSEKGKEQQPVIIDFGDIEYSGVAKTIEVKTVAEEDMDDWMLRGAHYLRWVNNVSVIWSTVLTPSAQQRNPWYQRRKPIRHQRRRRVLHCTRDSKP